jgi:TM2 domain-containing membrane protein YozV
VNYYIAEGTTQRGPFSEQDLVGAGLKRENLVWREGMPQWLPAHQVAELQPYLTPASAAPVPLPGIAPVGYATPQYAVYPPAGDISGKKIAAGICGIFFGTFGVHKFIVGLNGGAVTMLVISVVCAVLAPFTCGITIFALPVMHVIGMIEGIIYLTKSDAEFYNIYMIQQRQWF